VALDRVDHRRRRGCDRECLPEAGGRPHAAQRGGTSASTGVATGAAVFDPERAATVKKGGRAIALIRENAETSDIGALSEAAALIATEGARTSHAAVVARELGKVCIVGCEGLIIDPSGRKGAFGAETIEEGKTLSVDGSRQRAVGSSRCILKSSASSLSMVPIGSRLQPVKRTSAKHT
jgi:pyruvate,orthophosphate dikinase